MAYFPSDAKTSANVISELWISDHWASSIRSVERMSILIKNGTVVNEDAMFKADVLITDGKMA
ncbi:hypothetical protein ANCCEY_11962 [Ancylostoma ceylanicum]|uniref:Uncharacterized protein n=1 Tax=Ancylostoma ceylanicum TaxID=53326 RepID=A0A0D6LAC9_9BILA|nr:hypothetical protein ANCCEY_11962 [Ancylostoma ceylanicum]